MAPITSYECPRPECGAHPTPGSVSLGSRLIGTCPECGITMQWTGASWRIPSDDWPGPLNE